MPQLLSRLSVGIDIRDQFRQWSSYDRGNCQLKWRRERSLAPLGKSGRPFLTARSRKFLNVGFRSRA